MRKMFNDIGLILWLVAFFYVVLRSENKFRREHSSEHSLLVKETRELKEEVSNLNKTIIEKEQSFIFGLLSGALLGKKVNGEKAYHSGEDINIIIDEIQKLFPDIEGESKEGEKGE